MRHGRQVRRPRRGTGGCDAGRRSAKESDTLKKAPQGTGQRATGKTARNARNGKAPLALATRKPNSPFARIDAAVEAVRAGQMIIIVDDADRENEGDLMVAAEKVSPEAVNFMARYGRGLICLSMTPERLDELEIPMMVAQNTSRLETAF